MGHYTNCGVIKMAVKCENCGVEVTEKVAKYSSERLGRVLCFNDQKKIQNQPTKLVGENRPPKINEEVIGGNYDSAFYGMCFNQACENARTYEKTYEEARAKLQQYYNDVLTLAIKLTKKS